MVHKFAARAKATVLNALQHRPPVAAGEATTRYALNRRRHYRRADCSVGPLRTWTRAADQCCQLDSCANNCRLKVERRWALRGKQHAYLRDTDDIDRPGRTGGGHPVGFPPTQLFTSLSASAASQRSHCFSSTITALSTLFPSRPHTIQSMRLSSTATGIPAECRGRGVPRCRGCPSWRGASFARSSPHLETVGIGSRQRMLREDARRCDFVWCRE